MPVPDLGVLDTTISVVIVILLLSMVVQSIQTFVKKLSKFKSRQIRASIQRLLDHVAATAPPDPQKGATADKIMAHFETLGRTTAMGKQAVESISKVDLSKVVTSIEGAAFLPQPTRDSIAAFFKTVQDAQTAAKALSGVGLSPTAVAKLSEVRVELETLVSHLSALFDANDPTKVNAQLLVKDVLSLGSLDMTGVMSAVTQLRKEIEQASLADPAHATLTAAAKLAADLSAALGVVNTNMTQLVGRVRERIDAIESWYDTVMLGFEERYARHMRTWAFIISLAVVIALNADVFQVYRRLATSELSRQQVMGEYQTIQDSYKASQAKAEAVKESATATPEDKKKADDTIQDATAGLKNALDEAARSYPALGIEPIDWRDVTPWSPVGWLVMAALLSMGAPFWQDTLESLFGLKNFLRDRTKTKQVEQKSGEGSTH